jgi:hypothetical protein
MIEELALIKEQLSNLEVIIEAIKRRRTRAKLLQYSHSLSVIKENLVKLKRKLKKLPNTTEEDAEDTAEANDLIEDVLANIRERERTIGKTKTEVLEEDVIDIRSLVSEISGSIPIEQIMFLTDLSGIPQEIREELRLDLEEMQICYNSGAIRSTLGMCGRVLELVLARKYFDATEIDPIQQKWNIGILIKKSLEEHVINDQAIGDICNLINRSRIDSVHSTTRLYKPSQEEAKPLIEFTMNLVKNFYPSQT